MYIVAGLLGREPVPRGLFELRELALLPVAMLLLQLPLVVLAKLLRRPLSVAAVAAGWLLPLLLLLPWLDGQRLMAPCNMLAHPLRLAPYPAPHAALSDTLFQLIPWELEVRHALAERRLPLWSDRLDGGSSPWANPQAQALSPVAMLTRLLPIQHHLLVALALKLLVACQGAWVLCRLVGARAPAALVGASAFTLGGGLLAWALFPLSTAVAWAPWVLAGVVVLARRATLGALLALAVATSALLLAGHPETAFGAILLAAAVGFALRSRRVSRRRFFALAGAGGLLGAALAAPLLLPFAAVVQRSLRAGETLTIEHMPLPLPLLGWVDAAHVSFLRGPFSPVVYGQPYGPTFDGPQAWPVGLAGYTGLAAIAGAAAALAGSRRRRSLALVAGWATTLVLALQLTPVEVIRQRVPLLHVAESTRFLPVGMLALTVAAALGWEELARRGRARVWLAAAMPLALGLALTPVLPVALLAVATLGAAVLLRKRAGLAWGALAAALLLDLLPWGRAQLPADLPAFFYPRVPLVERVAAEVEDGGFRAVGEHLELYPSLLPVYGVREVRSHNPLAPRPYLAVLARAFDFAPSSHRYFSAFGNVEHPLLDFLGVRVVVSNLHQPEKHRLQRADRGDLLPEQLYRNPAALPRWFLPTAVELVPRQQTLSWIAGMRDARRVALVREETGGWQPESRQWRPGVVRPLLVRPGHVALAVEGRGDRLLATSLPGPFGWRASSEGTSLRTLTVNGAFLGVRVPAEVRRVELRYVPPGLVAGWGAAGAAVLALLLIVLSMRKGGGRPRPYVSSETSGTHS